MGKHRTNQEWIELFELFERDKQLFKEVYLDQYQSYRSQHSAYYRFREKYQDYKVRDIKTRRAKENAKLRLAIPCYYLGKFETKEGTFHLTARNKMNQTKQEAKEARLRRAEERAARKEADQTTGLTSENQQED